MIYKVNLKQPSITPIVAPDEPASATIGYAHDLLDAKAIMYLHAANIVAEAEAKLRLAREKARFIYSMQFEQPDFIEVEAVAILPIDEPVPDEWFAILLGFEIEREIELELLEKDSTIYYRKQSK